MEGERTTEDIGGRGPARGSPAQERERLRERGRTPVAPRDGEGVLRALFDSTLDAVLVATDDREYVDANPAACELLGVPREELLGSRLEDFVPEGQEEAARAAWGEFLERGWLEGEIALRRADGTVRVAEFRARAGFLPGQHLSVLRDVTERKRAEEALKESEERHRLIVEGARDYAIITADPEGRIASWSPGAEAVYGWTAEEALGRTTEMTFTPEDREAGEPGKELAIARREGVAPDVRWHLRKDGSRVFIEGTTRALRRGDGEEELSGYLKIGQDVTERKRTEEALRASEERYRTLVENVGDHAIFLLDARGFVIEWTEGARRVKGYAEEEVLGHHVSMFYAPEEAAAGDPERELSEAAREGRAEREGWRVKKGGERIWVEEIATAVRDEGGNLVGFTKISRDLTERRRAEEALREGEERLALAADAAGLGRWEFFPETGELLGDDAFDQHHGASPGSGLGFGRHLAAVHPDDREEVRHRVESALSERDGYEAEYRVVRPDGKVRWILSRGRFVGGRSGAPDCLVGVTLDVTASRELEKEKERARARELTARAETAERERISRELHDRVAHSMGVAHQALELHAALAGAAPERAEEKLELARETTRRALDQTRSLAAELKRMQEGELEEGMQAAFEALVETSVPDGVEVEVSVSGDETSIPKPVGVQVYLAMREAVRNAVKHSGCSRIRMGLEVGEEEVVGVVEDDGNGFDPEEVGKARPSWGVGLRSMRERAEMLGGGLRLAPNPGGGTKVEVRAPLDGRT